MPTYTFECAPCDIVQDFERSVAKRNEPVMCGCGQFAARIPERPVVHSFEPYYDEGLGCDISSRTERKAVMASLNLQEAGDAVHGARNWDQKNPVQMKKVPLRGVQHVKAQERDSVIKTHDEKGNVTSSQKFSDMPTEK